MHGLCFFRPKNICVFECFLSWFLKIFSFYDLSFFVFLWTKNKKIKKIQKNTFNPPSKKADPCGERISARTGHTLWGTHERILGWSSSKAVIFMQKTFANFIDWVRRQPNSGWAHDTGNWCGKAFLALSHRNRCLRIQHIYFLSSNPACNLEQNNNKKNQNKQKKTEKENKIKK